MRAWVNFESGQKYHMTKRSSKWRSIHAIYALQKFWSQNIRIFSHQTEGCALIRGCAVFRGNTVSKMQCHLGHFGACEHTHKISHHGGPESSCMHVQYSLSVRILSGAPVAYLSNFWNFYAPNSIPSPWVQSVLAVFLPSLWRKWRLLKLFSRGKWPLLFQFNVFVNHRVW